MIEKAKKLILDALFPIFCLSCHKEGYWLCESCFSRIKFLDYQLCPACENNITEKGFLCPACRAFRKSHLDSLIVAVSYENPAIKALAYNLKYRFVADIAQPLAGLMTQAILANNIPVPDFIVPVPLHPRRLRWRGFNQSLLLAHRISEELTPLLQIEVLEILLRKKYNRAQMKIKNYEERKENVKDIFALTQSENNKAKLIRGKNILLIDDIATTGATLEECAKALKLAGVKYVFAAVIARQSVKK